MKPIVRNILGFIVGVIAGSVVNMFLITISGMVIPLPEGVDATDFENLKSSMHLFEAKHFLFPFLAHALGTLTGALVAAWIATGHKQRWALGIGAFFLLGGIVNVAMLPAPLWFEVVDLAGAYFPMAWLGGKLAGPITKP